MSEPKRIPAAPFLMENGLLFEINRTILHPLGLALEVNLHEDGSMSVGDLWDYRDDQEGMLYDSDSFREGKAKYARFMDQFGAAKLAERNKTMGFVVQERDDQ